MELAFNELSINQDNEILNFELFYKQIEDLVSVLNLDKIPSITFNSDFANKKYNGKLVCEYINEAKLDNEIKQSIYLMIQNAPFSYSTYIDDNGTEVTFNGEIVSGFLYALKFNVPAISISTEKWNNFSYTLQKITLNEETEDLEESITDINHLGPVSNYEGSWLEELLPKSEFTNWAEFKEIIPSLYTKVVISDEAILSIKSFPIGQLNKLKNIMDILEAFCLQKWHVDTFRYHMLAQMNLKVRPESDATMRNYGDQRRFINENGDKEIYSLHFDIFDDWRGYIKPIEGKKLFIANIVSHLTTSKG